MTARKPQEVLGRGSGQGFGRITSLKLEMLTQPTCVPQTFVGPPRTTASEAGRYQQVHAQSFTQQALIPQWFWVSSPQTCVFLPPKALLRYCWFLIGPAAS